MLKKTSLLILAALAFFSAFINGFTERDTFTYGRPEFGLGEEGVCSEANAEIEIRRSPRESLSFLFGGNSTAYLKNVDATQNSLTTVLPDYFEIGPEGSLSVYPENKIDTAFIDEIHSKGIKVVPFLSNHWDRALGIKAMENRSALSAELARAADIYKLDGINVDIENLTEANKADYTDFVRLVRSKLPKNKSVSVSVAANPNDWKTGWHGSYDYKALSEHSDYLVIMAYDESYKGGPAGPVSSQSFFVKSIEYALSQGVPKEKIIACIPFFGRYWKRGEDVGGLSIAAGDVKALITNYYAMTRYDEAAQSANTVVTIGKYDPKPTVWGGKTLTEGTYDIWYDDEAAVANKLEIINGYDLRGAGSWALGQEDQAIWKFYTSVLNQSEPESAPGAAPECPPESAPATNPECPPESAPETNPDCPPESAPETDPDCPPDSTPEINPDCPPWIIPELPELMPNLIIHHYHFHYCCPRCLESNDCPPVSDGTKCCIGIAEPVLSRPGKSDAAGLINGKSGKNLNKKSRVTRGDAAGVIAEFMCLETRDGLPSGDSRLWEKSGMAALKRRGIIRDSEYEKTPDKPITRAELARFLDDVLELPDCITLDRENFGDVPISNEVCQSARKLVFFGIMKADGIRFYPDNNVSAEELDAALNSISSFGYSLNPDKLLWEKQHGKRIIAPR